MLTKTNRAVPNFMILDEIHLANSPVRVAGFSFWKEKLTILQAYADVYSVDKQILTTGNLEIIVLPISDKSETKIQIKLVN